MLSGSGVIKIPRMFFGAHANDITGVTKTVGIYNLLMMVGYWYIYKMTAGKDPYDEITTGRSQQQFGLSIWGMIRLAARNPPLVGLIFAEIFRNSYVLILTAYAFYYFKYVLNEFALLSFFILAISIARLSGTTVAAWFGNTIGKRNTYCGSLLLAAVGFGATIYWSDNVWSFTAIFCIASMLGMIAGSMSTVLFSDTVVYGEWKTGENNRAFTMALQSFAIKVAILIRSGVVFLGLMIIGFEANVEPAPQGVVEGIRHVMIFAPAIACILAAVVFFFGFKMDDFQVLSMQKEIEARKV